MNGMNRMRELLDGWTDARKEDGLVDRMKEWMDRMKEQMDRIKEWMDTMKEWMDAMKEWNDRSKNGTIKWDAQMEEMDQMDRT